MLAFLGLGFARSTCHSALIRLDHPRVASAVLAYTISFLSRTMQVSGKRVTVYQIWLSFLSIARLTYIYYTINLGEPEGIGWAEQTFLAGMCETIPLFPGQLCKFFLHKGNCRIPFNSKSLAYLI
jgi:hypothetical protein